MARNLFGTVASYLGVRPLGENELKNLTNVLKMKKLQFHAGEVLIPTGNADSLPQLLLPLTDISGRQAAPGSGAKRSCGWWTPRLSHK